MTSAFPFTPPPEPQDLDRELGEALRQCAKRSVPALRRIHDLFAPRLLAELLQMLGDRELAEAALVDCHVVIWNESVNFNPQRIQPRAWLLSIARHYAMDTLRATPRDPPEEVDGALTFLHVALEEEAVPAQQRMLQLAWRSGRSPAEIARALQMPLQRVRQAIRTGIDALAGSGP